jgi:serine/threonine-protein kinase
MPMPVVLRVVIDALLGLGAAHDLRDDDGSLLNLVHRDVSPHNVLVGRDGVARLTDFGVAKAEDRLANTRDGQVKGKIAYMAPEQASVGRCDARSDLFAMAIVLWECATGQRLFRAENSAATLHRLLHEQIPSLYSIDPELEPLDAVLRKALERSPELRYQSAEEFVEALERVAPALGGVAPRRLVSRAVERYAAEKLERDRRLIDSALVSLRSGQPLHSEPAPAMPESSSPSRTQQRIMRTGMTPAAGTVPRLFTSQRVRADSGAHLAAPESTPRGAVAAVHPPPAVAYPPPPPPLGEGYTPASTQFGAFDELLLVQARRRTRITHLLTALALLGAAGTAGWLWYASVRSPVPHARSTSSAVAPQPVAPPVEPTAPPPVVLPPATTLAPQQAAPTLPPQPVVTHEVEQEAQPPADRTAPAANGARSGGHVHTERGAGGTRSDVGNPSDTAPAPSTPPAGPTWQLTPSPAAHDDGLLPNPYRHD